MDEKVFSAACNKLDAMYTLLNDMRVDVEVMKTKMEQREDEHIPTRVANLERFKDRAVAYSSVVIVALTGAWQVAIHWVKGIIA